MRVPRREWSKHEDRCSGQLACSELGIPQALPPVGLNEP